MSDSDAISQKSGSFFVWDRQSTESPQELEARLRLDRPFFSFMALMSNLICSLVGIFGLFIFRPSDESITFWLWGATILGLSNIGSICGTLAAMIPKVLSMSADIEALKLALEAKSSSENPDGTD